MTPKPSTCETDYSFLAFESACDAVLVVVRSIIAAVNERAELFLSTAADELVGRPACETLASLLADEKQGFWELLFRDAEQGHPAVSTTRLLQENDAPLWVEIAVQRLDFADEPLLVFVRDVTEHYLNSQLLEQERQFVARIIGDFPAIICGTDADGMVTFVNSSAAAITGYDIDELVGSTWWDLLEPDPPASAPENPERASHLTTPKKEIAILRRDGTKRILEWSEIVRYNDEGRQVETIGLGNDITQLRSAAREMELSKNAAEAASRAMSDFLANMTHELRTPMNGVIGMSSLLRDTKLSKQQAAYVDTIRQCGASLLKLINEILELTSIENGKIELEHQRGSTGNIVDDLDALWRPKAEGKLLGFHWKIDSRIPPSFCTDFGRVKQVLSQLIANAVKFTREGGVTVCIASCSPESTGPSLRFTVEDTGIGIPEHARPHLFEKFYQADMSTTRQYGGAGLGLTVAKNLVELMGGQISVDTEEGGGSRFCAVIPIDVDKEAPCSKGADPAEKSTAKVLEDLDLSSEVDLPVSARQSPAGKPISVEIAGSVVAVKSFDQGEEKPEAADEKGAIVLSEQRPILEPQALLERLGGNEELCLQLYEMFAQTLPEKIRLIEAAIEEKDMDNAARLAHQLGGSCATVDARRLRAHVVELEKACLANETTVASSMMSRIRAEASLVKKAIDAQKSS